MRKRNKASKEKMILTDSNNHVENEVSEEDPNISPPFVVADIQRYKELISNLILTILARTRRIWVIQVSTKRINEFSSPLLACLPTWRGEYREFV